MDFFSGLGGSSVPPLLTMLLLWARLRICASFWACTRAIGLSVWAPYSSRAVYSELFCLIA